MGKCKLPEQCKQTQVSHLGTRTTPQNLETCKTPQQLMLSVALRMVVLQGLSFLLTALSWQTLLRYMTTVCIYTN
jgi:hypothetical protein